MTHIVVIGAGQAGAALVAKLRSEGFGGRITLIGNEPVLPYQRPPLSKGYLLGDVSLERLYLRPEHFYQEHDIDLRLGQTVTKIDPEAKGIHLGAKRIPYDQLALTTGASPRQLPPEVGGELQGVYTLRSLSCADTMAPAIKPGQRVLIAGGGYIGLEAAAVCAQKGMEVILIEATPRILCRVAAAETADYFRTLHSRHGVTIRENIRLVRLNGAARVETAELSDGTKIDLDLVLVGIGVTPNTQIAETAGLSIDNGIATDAQGRTSAPGIWAAGDCASFPYQNRRIRLESVPHAIEQAENVACNMLGQNIDYEAKPWFWSDQYDVKLQIAGLNTGYDRVVVRQTDRSCSHWYFAGDTLLAIDAMNDPRAYMVAKRLIEAGQSPPLTKLTDLSFDLKLLLQ